MKTLKLAMYVALDDVVEEPMWTGPFWNQELSDLQAEYLYSSDALGNAAGDRYADMSSIGR